MRENKEAFPIIFLLFQEIQDINLFPLVWNHKGIYEELGQNDWLKLHSVYYQGRSPSVLICIASH